VKKVATETLQAIYAEKNIDAKKTLILNIIDNFQYKAKQEQFRASVLRTNSNTKLDTTATNLLLNGEGLRVI